MGRSARHLCLFSKKPVDFLEVDYYGNFKGRSRLKLYDIDHIPSQAAIRIHFKNLNSELTDKDIDKLVKQVAAVAIPKEVHQKCSETYGGRNNSWVELEDDIKLRRKEYDSQNLKEAVERNWKVERQCLKAEHNVADEKLDEILAELHRLNRARGLYK